MPSIKVLHAPTTVGGNPPALSKAQKQLGLDSEVVDLEPSYFAYHADHVIWDSRDRLLVREFKRLRMMVRLLPSVDIIHFNFGTSLATPYVVGSTHSLSYKARILSRIHAAYLRILQRIELFFLRLANKPLFVTYQGDDARQGDYSRENFVHSIAHHVGDDYYNKKTDAFKRKSISLMNRFCEKIYSVNPDLLHVLPDTARFIPYGHIFPDDIEPRYLSLEDRPLRICHAPTSRQAKGTDKILAVLQSLQQQGYRFELILVEGLSHANAMQRYRECDLLIDQIYAGWYGGLAVEVMAMGKPVMAYIRDDDLRFIPSQMADDLPILRISPDSLEQDLKKILEMPRGRLHEVGRKGRCYVERWHDPVKIAREISEDYYAACSRLRKEA